MNPMGRERLSPDEYASGVTVRARNEQPPAGWNETAVAFAAADACVHRLIAEQAARTPEQTAVAFEQRRLTYRELDRKADRVARHLLTLGAGPDVLVGLFVERSLEMVVGMLGILKAGAAYLPVDPADPRERTAFLIADSDIGLIVTLSSLVSTLPATTAQCVCLDTFDPAAPSDPVPIAPLVGPRHLAYVIYTSGSTGRPKGVCIEHRNIVNYALGVSQRLQFEAGMNHAMVSTVAADLGNTVIFGSLVTGGCLHVISPERAGNQALLADYFSREHVDVLKIVPSHLAALQAGRDPAGVMPRRRLILGGEASRIEWIEQLRTLAPNCTIFNHYGPTETTVGVLTYRAGPRLSETRSGTLSLGRPLPNSRIHLLDESGHPVPIGEQGELYIGGSGVARGYLNRADLTGEKFLPDPFAKEPGARLYRTGDLARYLPDGNVEFCGRIDHQVKIHGYRVELGEIEETLRAQPGVREAVVLARDEGLGKQLTAYVVPQRVSQPIWGCDASGVLPDGSPVAHLDRSEGAHEQILSAAALRKRLIERLPHYMVPTAYVLIEKLPLTSNGKIDRNALPDPSRAALLPSGDFAPPRTRTESTLAAIWSALLNVERVGINDDFFELGGDSLLAIQAMAQLRDAFNVDLALRHLFDSPTVAQLATTIEGLSWLSGSAVQPHDDDGREEFRL